MLDITHENLDSFFVNNAPYLVRIDGRQVCADPRDRGEPGDAVVVWPKKRGPMMLRRLARCAPFDSFYFAAEDEEVVRVPCNKITAIHKIVRPGAVS